MSAVMEMTQEEVQAWKMPRPARGQQILWFSDADRTKEPEVGFVQTIGNRSLVIQVGRTAMDSVRHIDDPKLQLNETQRAHGAWDFPQSEKALLQEFAELKSRVEALEKRMAPAATPKKKVDDSPL